VQTFKFKASDGPKTSGFTVDVTRAPDPKDPPSPNVSVRGDHVSEQDNKIPRSHVKVSRIEPNGTGGLDVDVRVDPSDADAGRYTTTLQFGGRGYSGTLPVVIQVSRKDTIWIAVLCAFLGWLAGSGLKLVTDLFGAKTQPVTNRGLGHWLTSGGIPILVGGFLAAAAACLLSYLPNDTWGADTTDLLRLGGTALGAAVAGNSVGDIAARLTGGSDGNPNPPG
jgi:hypothetical protein